MLKHVTRMRLIQIWFAVVALASTLSAVLGGVPTIGTGIVLLGLSIVPAAMVLMLWPGAQPLTAAEVIRGGR